MRERHRIIAMSALLSLGLAACDKPANPGGHTAPSPSANSAPQASERTPTLKTETDKLSYAIGMDIGNSLKGLDTDFNRQAMFAAISDQLDGKKPALDPKDAAQVKQSFFQKRAEKANKERIEAGKKNLEEGKKFREEYAKREQVHQTDSGLMYEVLKEADGPKPKATDRVTVHYRGTLIDGTEFDSSYKRGKPATFPLNGVIKGWTEGLQLMSVGSKFKFVIPPELAYGANGAGRAIGPNATLIFEVELLGIESQKDKNGS